MRYSFIQCYTPPPLSSPLHHPACLSVVATFTPSPVPPSPTHPSLIPSLVLPSSSLPTPHLPFHPHVAYNTPLPKSFCVLAVLLLSPICSISNSKQGPLTEGRGGHHLHAENHMPAQYSGGIRHNRRTE